MNLQNVVFRLTIEDADAQNRTIPLLTLDELTAMGKRQVAAKKAAKKRVPARGRKAKRKS